MILGVLVRDVDSGNAEREPIDDPTGWGVMSAAGTNPSEKPLIPIGGDKNPSCDRTTSIDSRSNSNSRTGLSFTSNAHLEFLEQEDTSFSDRTPRPNRYMFEDIQGMSGGKDTLPVDGKMSTEPESLIMDSGSSRVTKTHASSTSSQSYLLEPSRLYQQQEKPLPLPNPIQPPRITANVIPKFRPSFSSQSRSSYVSTPDSSTTSSSYNAAINYGGANGGKMTEVEKKRYELQMRVYRARTQMPSHIVLRIFREPAECVEVEEEMLRREARL